MILHRRLAWRRIEGAARVRAASLVAGWLPDGTRHGGVWRSTDPTCPPGHQPMLEVDLSTGAWSGARSGRDLIGLTAHLGEMVRPEAALLLARLTGVHPYE